jgi:nicotinamidase-related amidase
MRFPSLTLQKIMTTALLVVDVQESFPHRPYWDAADVPEFLTQQNRLIAGFIRAKLPIVRVFHIEPEGVFSKASGFVRPLNGLMDFREDFMIEKTMHSAFAGSPLAIELAKRGIGRVAVSGIRTEQCCETTTRDASDRGLEVDFVSPATLTFAMTHPDGRTFSATQIRERTELVLHGRFATVCTVDDALTRATA